MPISRRHCDAAALVDHARGLGSTLERERVEAHLADCPDCRAHAAALAALTSVARRDLTEHPGRAAMQRATAIAATAGSDAALFLPRWIGRVLEGGLPVGAGLRAAPGGRQAVYKAGPYVVRVRLEAPTRDGRCVVLGQVEPPPSAPVVDALPVLATVGTRVLARTTTNRHGEFDLTCDAAGWSWLQVVVHDGARRLELPLVELLSASADQH